jgi:hypothetical protein
MPTPAPDDVLSSAVYLATFTRQYPQAHCHAVFAVSSMKLSIRLHYID